MYIQGNPAKIESPPYWNLLGRSMRCPPPVFAQQYSPASFVSLQFHARKEKCGAPYKNVTILNLLFKELRKCGIP